MLTTCPACLTRFRIQISDLKPRRGLVRCSQCRVVFDARDMMQPESGDAPPEAFFMAAMEAAALPLNDPTESLEHRIHTRQPPAKPWLIWAVPILVLALAAQIYWATRPEPVPTNPFQVEFSALERWPGDALRLRVSFSNRSAEAHPWPAFRLKITEAGRSAERVIRAAEYQESGAAATMAAGSEHEVRLLLAADMAPDRYEVTPIYP